MSGGDLVAICKREPSLYKASKTVEFWAGPSRTGVGKVLKRKVRDRFWEGHAPNILGRRRRSARTGRKQY